MTPLLLASAGLALGGPVLAALCVAAHGLNRLLHRRPPPPSLRPILLLLLVELRSGKSVLSGLQSVAAAFPQHPELGRAVRVATVDGATAALTVTTGDLHQALSQLVRAQRSGAPLAATLRTMIEADLAREKTRRIERARRLPIRLMIPVTLMVLPGLILLLYAPALLHLISDLIGPLT